MSTQVHDTMPVVERRESKQSILPWIVAGVLGLGFIVVGILYLSGSKQQEQVVRALIHASVNTYFAQQSGGNSEGGHIAISPDGRKIAFVAVDSLGKPSLYVRSLNSLTALPLPGTEGAYYPFWSPNSDFIGFFIEGKLKKIDASGGPPLTICDAQVGRGGTWSKNDIIVFAPTPNGALFQVPAAGGTATKVTTLDTSNQETTHRFPWFLPDGKHFLYFVRIQSGNDNDKVCIGSLDGTAPKKVVNTHSNAIYADGYVLFVREQTLLAQPFDIGNFEVSGNAVPIAEHLRFNLNYNHGSFSASQNGVLIYEGGLGPAVNQLAFLSRTGEKIDIMRGTQSVYEGAFSPDGTRIAYSSTDLQQRNEDIWVYRYSTIALDPVDIRSQRRYGSDLVA